MNLQTLPLILLMPALGLISCSSSDLRIVDANPEIMYEFGDRRLGEVLILEGETSKPKLGHKPKNSSGLRLPNMVDLPSKKELESSKPDSNGSSGGVISRPPVD